jgi:hypothetical protein
MAALIPFTDEQSRALINLEQRYSVWIEVERALAALPYDLRRKTVGGHDYLYEITGRDGNGRSLGRWSDEHAARFAAYREEKALLKDRRDSARASLDESGRLARALRTPMLAADAGPLLREADRRAILGSGLLVVGTNAMPAYALEANAGFRGVPAETLDLDLAWTAVTEVDPEQSLWPLLKAVDPTFTVNTERTFQARNAKAYEVEILVAPSLAATMPRTDRPRPVPLPEQEWLLLGRPVDRVVPCRDATAARIVAPDPRWFALHKLWLADQPKRNPLKRSKDRAQGGALLAAAAGGAFALHPLDAAFEKVIPAELAPFYAPHAS